MTAVSLFSGIGGLDLAAERAGFDVRLVCEIDARCRRVLARQFPTAMQHDDVKTLTGAAIRRACGGRPTIIFGGFPCQPFSVAGKRAGARDERHLWPEFARLICEAEPEWVVGENVRGILSVDDGRVFGAVLGDLADLGYRVGWGCWGADEAAGASHRRDRVFIVAYPDDGRQCAGGREPNARADRWNDPGRGSDHAVGDSERGVVRQDAAGRVEEQRAAAGGPGPELDDASLERCQWPGYSRRRRVGPENPGLDMGDAEGERLRRSRAFEPNAGHGRHSVAAAGYRYPPGPADRAGWSAVLAERPDLAPALSAQEEVELAVRPVVDGVSRRLALRMLGNAVVPDHAQPLFDEIARATLAEVGA